MEVRRSCLRRALARRARLIRKVYGVDPLCCPRCGGTMRVIAVNEQPAVIQQILDHLGIPVPARADRSPPVRMTLESCGEPARNPAVCEVTTGTYEPLEDDLPLPEPLTL